MMGAERPETGVALILGVDTHLHFHVELWPWTTWVGF